MAQKKCPECKGRGEIPCPMDYGEDGDEGHPHSCPVCGGDKKVRVACTECEGTGKVDER